MFQHDFEQAFAGFLARRAVDMISMRMDHGVYCYPVWSLVVYRWVVRVVLLVLCASASVLSAPYQAHALTLIGVPLALWRFRKDVALGALALTLVAPAVLLAGVGLQTAETHADGQITHRVKGDGDWPPRTVLR